MEESPNHNSDECYCECSNYECSNESEVKENGNNKPNTHDLSFVESYLCKKRILDLINFMLTKVIAEAPKKPVLYLEKLLDDCINFLAHRSPAPTLYETRHLEAVLKSFDPSQRGWLIPEQIQRLYESLGFKIDQNDQQDNVAVDIILEDLKNIQELELCELLLAGNIKCTANM